MSTVHKKDPYGIRVCIHKKKVAIGVLRTKNGPIMECTWNQVGADICI